MCADAEVGGPAAASTHPGGGAAVRVMISSKPGNADHLEKLTAAVRRALVDRDPPSANRAIRGLGAVDGFQTQVGGV